MNTDGKSSKSPAPGKSQTPNPESQENPNFQPPNSQLKNRGGIRRAIQQVGVGIWSLELPWSSGLGAWCLHRCPPVIGSLILVLSASAAAYAGTITGAVRAEGKPGTETDVLCSKYDSRQFKFVERVNYAEMHDFVVYIEGPVGASPVPPAQPAQVVTSRVMQKGAMFSPHVLPIVAGTTVEWPNHDEILHNVFSASAPNDFDLGLYKSPKVASWKFDQ